MSSAQVFDCTKLIIEEFWYLRPEEIMYAFKLVKMGKYGVSFNRMDAPTILLWIRDYVQTDRFEEIERQNREAGQVKQEVALVYNMYAHKKKEIAENLKLKAEKQRIASAKANQEKVKSDTFVVNYFEQKSKNVRKSPF